MRIRKSVLAVGSGLVVLLGVGVPAVAYADGGSGSGGTPASASCPRHDVRTAVKNYLAAHPDVAAEVRKLRSLPADSRAAARKAYLAQHPDVASALRDVRGAATADWTDALVPVAGYLADHPDVADLLAQLEKAPAAQRHQVASDYLAAHPGTQADLRGAVKALRQSARACRTGGK